MTTPRGSTFSQQYDGERLASQLVSVKRFLGSGEWHTLREIVAGIGAASEAGVSARLRELRAMGFNVEKRRRDAPERGIWEYSLTPKFEGKQGLLGGIA